MSYVAVFGIEAAAGGAGNIQTLPASLAGDPGVAWTLSNAGTYSGPSGAAGNWVLPTAYANKWQVMLTDLGGASPSGAAVGSWLALSTSRTWFAGGTGTVRMQFREALTGVIRSTQDQFWGI